MTTFLLFLAIYLAPQTTLSPPPTIPADPTTPVGHWVADHPGGGSTVLWWNFRPDGTVAVTAGVINRSHFTLDGNTLTLEQGDPGPAADTQHVEVTETRLRLISVNPHRPTTEFTRIGPPPTSGNLLFGTWGVNPGATSPEHGALSAPVRNTRIVYSPDGTYELRMPIMNFEGSWSATAHTYTLPNHPPLAWNHHGANLVLDVPSNIKDHVYRPDTFPSP